MNIEIKLIIASTFLITVGILLTYFLTHQKLNKKVEKYRTLAEALKATKEQLAKTEGDLIKAKQLFLHVDSETKALQALKNRESELDNLVQSHLKKAALINKKIHELEDKLKSEEIYFRELVIKLDLYTRIEELVDHGHFEIPEYLYETSERFAEEIRLVRDKQKEMISNKSAVNYPATTVISKDSSINKKILGGQVKLMLTAFNIECDTLIGKVKPSTFPATLERIEKLANSLEKSAGSLACGFDIKYINLKFEECRLQFQYTLKKQDELEEQKAIREQIKEEQKAIKEYERAIAEAEKEEKMYRQLLEKARLELLSISEEERLSAEARISALEQQLAEAEFKEARAKSMAEQTRKGHVYVISNIGSFGKDIYKIGLTRRLDPMDRVKELGDASVPFSFDVHAMVYVEDAPALESALHKEFKNQRVNLVNQKKEFFNVSLLQIKQAVSRIAGLESEFKTTIAAEEYYESLRLRGNASAEVRLNAQEGVKA